MSRQQITDTIKEAVKDVRQDARAHGPGHLIVLLLAAVAITAIAATAIVAIVLRT